MSGRLVVVSNRIAPLNSGTPPSGGLAVAVYQAMKETGGVWFGWSGRIGASTSATADRQRVGRIELATVDLSQEDHDAYYRDYANAVLWPMLHYRPELMAPAQASSEGYMRVNRSFAQALIPLLKPDDVIVIHDYHLIPLGRVLRQMGVSQPMAFFLHVPWPAPDIARSCTQHRSLVEALGYYDLIGLHTPRDVQNLRDYLLREAGGRNSLDGASVEAFGKNYRIQAFPIGIDPDLLADEAAEAIQDEALDKFRVSLIGQRLMIGVDRLDYSKGLPRRLAAFEQLLAEEPDLHGKVAYLQIAPTSRGDVDSYQALRQEMEALAGRINGRFGTIDWTPLRYVNRGYDRRTLLGLMRSAEVCLVTPLRDGMNLVAKEYVAAQDPSRPGALVLSEFAGAAMELDSSILINPHDLDSMVSGMKLALSLPLADRRARWSHSMNALRSHPLSVWHKELEETLKMVTRAQAGSQGGTATTSNATATGTSRRTAAAI